jgi:predicted nucleic acid-binding protein
MKVAFDTNLLVYVEGINSADRRAAAVALVRRLQPRGAALVPVQALGELYNVLVRKAAWPAEQAQRAVLAWRDTFPLAPTTEEAMMAAVALARDHKLQIWDSIMISVADESGCRLLLSEDLQDGLTWRGVTVVNPFAVKRHPLLDALLADTGDEEGERVC